MSLRHAWSVVNLKEVNPKEANTFPRRGKRKEKYMKCGTLEEVAYKMGY